jgi:predicted dehydrogenase
MMIHDFDMARFLTGSEVAEVFARAPLVIGLAALRSLPEGRPVRPKEVQPQ